MSLLAKFLQAKDNLMELAIKQLEDHTGNESADTELIGEMLEKSHDGAKQLGLAPDFNGKELYFSLINRVKSDNQRVAKLIGSDDPDDVEGVGKLAIKYVKNLKIDEEGWFLKESVARRLLKAVPPANIMKQLGYKQVDKMLANEDLYELFVALRFGEDSNWMNKRFLSQYKKLTFKDFEHRKIRFVHMQPAKWGYDLTEAYVKKKVHNITHSKEMGVITVVPMRQKTMSGITLKVLPLLLHYVYEVRLYSAFFKLISIKNNFGSKLLDTLVADTANVSILSDKHKVHWRVIQRYFGKLKDENHPEAFEPHVHPEDLHWRKAEEVLYDMDPKLSFWKDMDYVAIDLGGDIVTFNLLDVAFSYSNGVKYEARYLYHFRESLWNEIFMRYMGKKVLEQEILEQLDNELIAPEKIKVSSR